MTVEEAKWRYKLAFKLQQEAEKDAENLRENCLDHYKQFKNKIIRVNELNTATNVARRDMIDLIEKQW